MHFKATQPKVEEKSSIDDFLTTQSKLKATSLLKHYCKKYVDLEISHFDDRAEHI